MFKTDPITKAVIKKTWKSFENFAINIVNNKQYQRLSFYSLPAKSFYFLNELFKTVFGHNLPTNKEKYFHKYNIAFIGGDILYEDENKQNPFKIDINHHCHIFDKDDLDKIDDINSIKFKINKFFVDCIKEKFCQHFIDNIYITPKIIYFTSGYYNELHMQIEFGLKNFK